MFSFHRPKVYRSSTGCCICKAKSSSSRFTDSKKYEEDFLECFKLATPRQGEICNACVLLVKRWKKLPAGSDRNWQHVVDARAGPGMKSFTKFKTKNKKLGRDKSIDKIKKKHFEREYSPVSDKSDPADDDMHDMDYLEDGTNMDHSPSASDVEDTLEQKGRRRKGIARRRDDLQHSVSGFIDFDYWKPEVICCGMIFRGQNDEIIVDPSYLKPCSGRLARCQAKKASSMSPPATTEVLTKGAYSDSSSDSGYDDCSNQGIAMSPEAQGTNVSEARNVPVLQVNRVNEQATKSQVKSEDNLMISRQVADLMCHETMFPSKERSSPVHIMGHFQPEETAISH